jgi:hypothetical protein
VNAVSDALTATQRGILAGLAGDDAYNPYLWPAQVEMWDAGYRLGARLHAIAVSDRECLGEPESEGGT